MQLQGEAAAPCRSWACREASHIRGAISRLTVVSRHAFVRMLIMAMQAVVRPENIERLDLTPTEAYRTFLTMMIEGVLNEKGRMNE